MCMVVDECMDYAGTKLKRKLSEISEIPSPAPPEATPPDATWSAVIELLSVTSNNVYEALRIPLARSHNVPKKNDRSYHSLTKHHPLIEGRVMQPSENLDGSSESRIIPEADFEQQLLQVEAKLLEAQAINPQLNIVVNHTDIMCAKIQGMFEDFVWLMIDKFSKKNIKMKEDLTIKANYYGPKQ